MVKRWLVWALCLGLTGCGTIKKQWTEFNPDRDTAYLDEYAVAPITLPKGMAMNQSYLSDPYPLPKGALPPAGAEPIDIFPPTLKMKEPVNDDNDTADESNPS